jgi:tyrosinase
VLITITFDGAAPGQSIFLGWTPRPATITLTEIPAGYGTIPIRVASTGPRGRLVFTRDRAVRGTGTLDLVIDPASPAASLFVAGEFQFASEAKDDAEMTVTAAGTAPAVEAKQGVTVRVRKDANSLSAAERDRFLFALARVNNQGLGPFQAIRDMHRDRGALRQAHRIAASPPLPPGNEHFLPWHRAYLLDLERHLQAEDPSVALPYWKFDERAEKIFTPGFIGATPAGSGGTVRFAPTNPLIAWRTDSGRGIVRRPQFDQQSQSPLTLAGVLSEGDVMNLGGDGNLYRRFTGIEEAAHNGAHGSFDFDLSSPQTAPRDPLFFLLHCNVDRLWAQWQWLWNRFARDSAASYSLQGQSAQPTDVGRRTLDTMWPWDNVVGGQRPDTVPRAGMPGSPTHAAPGPAPSIASMIDYQGKLAPADELGFDYYSVPFWN